VRDNAAKPVGTATLSGTVMSDEVNPRPLRRVTVTLQAGALEVPKNAVTDDNGQFVFTDLPAATYTLTAQRAGFVEAFYGGKKPGKGPGVPVAIVDGQRLTGITVKMMHGAVIAGTVRFPSGQPVVDLSIQVMQMQIVDGQKRAQPVLSAGVQGILGASTNDRGDYRIFGLPPGEYVVQARVPVAEVRPVTAADVQWAQQSMSTSGIGGGGASAPLPPTPPPAQTATYSPVFYPGVADASAAASITLGPSEERTGVDFATVLVPTAKITGTVFDPDGHPQQGASVSLKPVQADSGDLQGMVSGLLGALTNGRTGPDGVFTINSATPGRYTLSVKATPRPAAPPSPPPGAGDAASAQAAAAEQRAAAMADVSAMLGGGNGSALWAMQDLTVDGHDQSGLSLTLAAGMTVSGKVVFEGTTLPQPTDLKRTMVMLSGMSGGSSGNAQVDQAASILGGSMASANADGTFSLKGVTPSKYRLVALANGLLMGLAAPQTGGWILKSAMFNGRDLADYPLDVKPNEDVTGIVATFTDRPTELSGAVQDQNGRPTGGYPIIVFSTDRSLWAAGSRRVQQVRPSSDGKFKVVGLPAGEYYVAAVVDFEPNDLANPAFLEQLAASSFKITFADGEKKVQDLKLGGS
jgi:hypothetical protein